MGFIKVGDPTPISGMLDPKQGDEQAVCPKCHKPLLAVAFNDEGDAELACVCDNPDMHIPEFD